MKATGYIKKLDRCQRLQIPKSLRRDLGIGYEVKLEIFTANDSIIIEKHKDCCYICGNTEDVIEFKEKHICKDCIDGIKNL